MKVLTTLLFAVMLSWATAGFAQLRHVPLPYEAPPAPKKAAAASVAAAQPQLPDTVYSHNITRRNGWIIPLGELTPAQVARRRQSFRFTGRTPEGHWTLMETVDGRGKPVEGGPPPYIVNLAEDGTDPNSDKAWVDKVNRSSVYEMIPAPSGREMSQLRVYDTNRKLLYTYSEAPGRYGWTLGSYRDEHGLPAEMKNADEEYVYGTAVYVLRDENGYDEGKQYLDAKGNIKIAPDGVKTIVTTYDEGGHYIGNMYLDEDNVSVNRETGGGGALFIWDDESHLMTGIKFIDKDYNTIPAPETEEYKYHGVNRVIRNFDDFMRLKEEIFYDEDFNPIPNAYGAYMVSYGYDDDGYITYITGSDFDGNFAPYMDYGIAGTNYYYDDEKRLVKVEYLQPDGSYAEAPYLSRKLFYFGDVEGSASYYMDDGEEALWYGERRWKEADGSSYETRQWADGTSQLVEYDPKGRLVMVSFTDADGEPVDWDDSYSLQNVSYREVPGGTFMRTRFWMADGTPSCSFGYDRREVMIDSVARSKTFRDYRGKELVQIYCNFYSDDFSSWTGAVDLNEMGVPSRGGGEGNIRFYRAEVQTSPFHDRVSLIGVDEFGEPDYLRNYEGRLYHYLRATRLGSEFRDAEDGLLDGALDDFTLRNKVAKMIGVTVTDSIGYLHGLKDDDVVIQFGSYMPELRPGTLLEEEVRGRWALRTILEGDTSRSMVVFRVDPALPGGYGLVRLQLPAGSPSQLGFFPYMRYLTPRQHARILGVVEADGTLIEWPPLPDSSTLYDWMDVPVALPAEFRALATDAVSLQVKDPAVITGTLLPHLDYRWTMGEGEVSGALPDELYLGESEEEHGSYPERFYLMARSPEDQMLLRLDGPYDSGIDVWNYEVTASDIEAVPDFSRRFRSLFSKGREQVDSLQKVYTARPKKERLSKEEKKERDYAMMKKRVDEFNEPWYIEEGGSRYNITVWRTGDEFGITFSGYNIIPVEYKGQTLPAVISGVVKGGTLDYSDGKLVVGWGNDTSPLRIVVFDLDGRRIELKEEEEEELRHRYAPSIDETLRLRTDGKILELPDGKRPFRIGGKALKKADDDQFMAMCEIGGESGIAGLPWLSSQRYMVMGLGEWTMSDGREKFVKALGDTGAGTKMMIWPVEYSTEVALPFEVEVPEGKKGLTFYGTDVGWQYDELRIRDELKKMIDRLKDNSEKR